MPHRTLCPNSVRVINAACVVVASSSLLSMPAGATEPMPTPPLEDLIPPGSHESPIFYDAPIAGSNVGDVQGIVPEALLQQFLQKHSTLDYPAAAELAMRLIEATPNRPIGYYNLACAMARMGRTDEAIDALAGAVQRGWRDVVHTNIDPDLSPLRSEAGYAAVVADLKSRIEAERIRPQPLRGDGWEAMVEDILQVAPPMLEAYHVPGASIALIHNGEVVWNAAFGRREDRGDAVLGTDDRFRLRAPLHLLAVAACDQLEQRQKLQFASLIVEAANLHGELTVVEHRGGAIGAQPANLRDREAPVREFVANVRMPARMFSRDSAYGFLRSAVEETSDESFPRFCEQSLLIPMAMRKTSFVTPGEGVHVATGHSALGTPLRPNVVQGEFAPGGCLYMTAGDVARLIASSMTPSFEQTPGLNGAAEHEGALPMGSDAIFGDEWSAADAARLGSAIEVITKADVELSGSLGLAVKRGQTAAGARYELNEAAAGIVLLARWHPQTRSGIVIVCNSVTGRDAAERIAHAALGGE